MGEGEIPSSVGRSLSGLDLFGLTGMEWYSSSVLLFSEYVYL